MRRPVHSSQLTYKHTHTAGTLQIYIYIFNANPRLEWENDEGCNVFEIIRLCCKVIDFRVLMISDSHFLRESVVLYINIQRRSRSSGEVG